MTSKIDTSHKYLLISCSDDQTFSIVKSGNYIGTKKCRNLKIGSKEVTFEIFIHNKWYDYVIHSSSNEYSTVKRRAERLKALEDYEDFVHSDLDAKSKCDTVTKEKISK
jgi:hypothetical protein